MEISYKRSPAAWLAVVFFCAMAGNADALDWPRFSSLSERAADEMREEEAISEVLSRDASYRDLFSSIRNPDVHLERYVRPGEELRFQAKWRGLPAGSIRLSAKRVAMVKNRPAFVFELNVESNDFLNAFYPINTSVNSYVDVKNGRSYLTRRRVSERNRGYKDRLEFKYDFRLPNGLPDPVSKYSMVGEGGQEIASQPVPIPCNMQDMVSVIYYIRGLNLRQVGDSCNLMVGGRTQPIVTTLKVVGEEAVNIPDLGNFDCLVIEPDCGGLNLSGNLVASRGAERVWLEKNTRIPVQVAGELPKPLGMVVATLVQADNSPLTRFARQ